MTEGAWTGTSENWAPIPETSTGLDVRPSDGLPGLEESGEVMLVVVDRARSELLASELTRVAEVVAYWLRRVLELRRVKS